MFADYVVVLIPGADGLEDAVPIEDSEPGFNQMGWLVFTNHQREPIAFFTPTSVRYVVQTGISGETLDVEAVDLDADDKSHLVN